MAITGYLPTRGRAVFLQELLPVHRQALGPDVIGQPSTEVAVVGPYVEHRGAIELLEVILVPSG